MFLELLYLYPAQLLNDKVLEIPPSLILSPGHFLFVNDELAPAWIVKPGDKLNFVDGSYVIVSAIKKVFADGLYNPQTLDGKIIVNNIQTSVYTDAIRPDLAHALLAPIRVLWEAGVRVD